jgi:hypothetical protein
VFVVAIFLVVYLVIVDFLRKACTRSPRVDNSEWLTNHLVGREEFKVFHLLKND